jgi:hypothetical protein
MCQEDWKELEKRIEKQIYMQSVHKFYGNGQLLKECRVCGLNRIEWVVQFDENINAV